jgi:hypothetical protein
MWLAPCFLALAIVCLVTGTARAQAAFYLSAMTLMVLGLLWAFWISRVEIHLYLFNNTRRVVTGVEFVAAAGLVHLAARVLLDGLPAARATRR